MMFVLNGRDAKSDDYADSSVLIDVFNKYRPSHIVLGPGPEKPQDSKITMKIAQLANDGVLNLPVLGVCLGHHIGLSRWLSMIKDPNGAVHGAPVIVRVMVQVCSQAQINQINLFDTTH